jgi:hypothetical protein
MSQPFLPPRSRLAARRVWALLGCAAAVACSRPPADAATDAPATPAETPNTAAVAAPTSAPATATATPPRAATVTVYKSPSCGCCRGWVEHLQRHGYTVEVHDTEDMAPVKAQLGVPDALGSCHTATVAGYVVEGHVPASDIERLLATRPAVLGIAVPGMPTGSPGMEVPGAPSDRYDVVSFDRGGGTRVFASH